MLASTSLVPPARRRLRPEHVALGAILALSALLVFGRLSQNGFANVYYSAAVRSMLGSPHNFFFVSADPKGLITVDKPPLALWLQALSAKIFGFAPASLLIPEGICAVLAVALLYRIVAPRFGAVAGLLAAFALAVFPSFVAVGRDNGVDPLLILFMLAACGAALTATERGSLRWLVGSAVLVGLAFNTKSLAAMLCVPGIAVAYLFYAPGSWRRRVAQSAAAGAVGLVVAVAWIAAVQLTPASQRPFIGSTTNNSEIQLLFGYNGFGRVGGQQGGPGTTIVKLDLKEQKPLWIPGYNAPLSPIEQRLRKPTTVYIAESKPTAGRPRAKGPIPFGGSSSPVRIFGTGLGDQAGWEVPLGVVGLLVLVPLVWRRRDRRAAFVVVLGGWMLVELVTLDFSAGIVHPYYASALAPGLAAMLGAGAVAIGALASSRDNNRALIGYVIAVLVIAATVAVQLVLIRREAYPLWWRIPLILLSIAALVAVLLARRGLGGAAVAAAAALMLVAPMAYSFSVWLAPVYGVFPAAGPYSYAGPGGVGLGPVSTHAFRGLIAFLATHGETSRYPLLAESSDQAAPLILLGLPAAAIGGYGASDPALSANGLANLVTSGQARYVLIGGPYADRGGNSATTAARLVCPEIPQVYWGAGANTATGTGAYLVDCKGLATKLRHPYRTAQAFLRAHPDPNYQLHPRPHV